MPRGGKRTPKDGKKLGRPKAQRVVDGNVARKIKARVKAEELWVYLVHTAAKKAKETGNTADLRNALEYLDNRDLGLCAIIAEEKISFDPNKPLRAVVEHIGRPSDQAAAKAKFAGRAVE